MKKITFISLISFLFLSLCSLFENLFRFIPFENAWTPLLIGVGILFLSGSISACIKKNVVGNCICFLINSIALGLCIRAWYVFRNFDNEWWVMLLVSLACVLYLLIFYFSLYIPFLEKHINVYIWIFLLLSLAAYITVVCFSETTYVSTFGYYMIIEIAFIFAMCLYQETSKDLFRDVVISTYSVLIVAIIIALIMLGADSLDGIDGFAGDLGSGITSPRQQKILHSKIID